MVLHGGHQNTGGVGIQDLYMAQGTEHIKGLLNHGGKDNPTGQLLDIAISGHVLEVGQSGHLFSMKF